MNRSRVGKIAGHGLTAWATARRDFAHAVCSGVAPLPTLRNASGAVMLSVKLAVNGSRA